MKKRKQMQIKHEFPSKIWFKSEIHCLLRQIGAIGSAEIKYLI